MKLLIVTDSYSPVQNSAALMIDDLARRYRTDGHCVTVLFSDPDASHPYQIDDSSDVTVIKFPALRRDRGGLSRRAIAELCSPFMMVFRLWRYKPQGTDVDGLIWYSPTIFFGCVIHLLKWTHNCSTYLVLRDIFPDWTLHTGIMRKGFSYYVLKLFERYQYWIADTIGLQAPTDLDYFKKRFPGNNAKKEVLYNWLSPRNCSESTAVIQRSKLANRKILVYAGNMGVAQDLSDFIALARALSKRADYGFLFVGRGTEFERYKNEADIANLPNVLFLDFVTSGELSAIFSQCYAGLISLNRKHRTTNIPGKFLSYILAGLPVFGYVNRGNDLIALVDEAKVGVLTSNSDTQSLLYQLSRLEDLISDCDDIQARCEEFYSSLFSTEVAAQKILSSLESARQHTTVS